MKKEIGVLVDYLDDLDVVRITARLREVKKDDLDLFDKGTSRLMGNDFAKWLNTGMRVEIDDKLLCLVSMLKTWSNEKLVNI